MHIILVTLDSVRADTFYENIHRMKSIRRLKERTIIYKNVISPGVTTFVSLPSILSCLDTYIWGSTDKILTKKFDNEYS